MLDEAEAKRLVERRLGGTHANRTRSTWAR